MKSEGAIAVTSHKPDLTHKKVQDAHIAYIGASTRVRIGVRGYREALRKESELQEQTLANWDRLRTRHSSSINLYIN